MDAAQPRIYIFGSRTPHILLPSALRIADVEFCRTGEDLVLIGPRGWRVIAREYFSVETPPDLSTADGDTVRGDLARILVNLSERAVSILLARRDDFPVAG